MAKIALNFEDGYTRIIEGWLGESVADTAYRMGINVPIDCGDGACGTCKCRVRSGNYDMGENFIDEAITAEELKEGFALACQMRPESNVVIDIFASSSACKVKTETFETSIISIEFLSSNIVKLKVKTCDGRKINFLSGQYANIEVPHSGKTRSYSFSTISEDELEFLVRLLPNGLMSNFLKEKAKIGDILKMSAPFGSFYLREAQNPILFFAGGTGIAPFLAMLESLAKQDSKQQIHLFYGATTDENLVELARLESFKKLLIFDYSVCVSVEKSEKYANGFVTQWITKEQLPINYDAYICGPPTMVDAVKEAITREGILLSNFYMEKFVPSGI
jgi:benzoate/toluate 1,2-dioxygenase reductase component